MGDVSIVLFRQRDEEGEPGARVLNKISSNTLSLSDAVPRISQHTAYEVEVRTEADAKAFRRQTNGLRELYINQNNSRE